MKFYRQNCFYFKTDQPCSFHKKNIKILCENCEFYIPVNKKILIIKLAALGDVLRTTSILKPLNKKYKNSKFFWITSNEAVEIFQNNPYISEVIPYCEVFNYFGKDFDILINLDLEQKALELTKKFNFRFKYGFYLNQDWEVVCSNKAAQEWFDISHNDLLKKQNRKTYQEYLMEILEFKNLKPSNYPIILKLSKDEKKFAYEFLKSNGCNLKDTFIGINLGSGDRWRKKEYPINKTVQLIKLLIDYFNNKKNIKILLFGGKKEFNRNLEIMNSLKNNRFYCEKVLDTGTNNTLRQFFSLINVCDLLIASDTLALHVGLALNKKVIALFGPTSFNEIEMYGLGEKVVTPKKCKVCYRRICNKTPDCMELISVKEIFNKVLKLINKK
ncbi:MAG: glycosyltransferase family 9 protein [Endomicrobiia bacterium]